MHMVTVNDNAQEAGRITQGSADHSWFSSSGLAHGIEQMREGHGTRIKG